MFIIRKYLYVVIIIIVIIIIIIIIIVIIIFIVNTMIVNYFKDLNIKELKEYNVLLQGSSQYHHMFDFLLYLYVNIQFNYSF